VIKLARQVVALHAHDLVCGQPLERAVNHTGVGTQESRRHKESAHAQKTSNAQEVGHKRDQSRKVSVTKHGSREF
jgi:hypothetical protein